MSAIKIAAIVLIAGGVASLIFGSFSYPGESHMARLGSMELTMNHRGSFEIPVWLGIGAVVLGGALLVLPRRRS